MRKLSFILALFIAPAAFAQSVSWNTWVNAPANSAFVDTQTRQIVRIHSPGASSDNTVYICGIQTGTGGTGANYVGMFMGSPAGNPTSFAEQDAAHHPTDGSNNGFMEGAECRVQDGSTTIQVAYSESVALKAYYNTFDTLTNTWGTQEQVGTFGTGVYNRYEAKTALALSSDGTAWIAWGGKNATDSLHLSHRTAPNTYASETVTATGVFRVAMAWDLTGNLNIAYMRVSDNAILFKQRSAAGSYTSEEVVSTAVGSDTYSPDDNGPSLVFDPSDGKPIVNWLSSGGTGENCDGSITNGGCWNNVFYKRTGTNTWAAYASPMPANDQGHSPAGYVDYAGNLYSFIGHLAVISANREPNVFRYTGSWSAATQLVSDGTVRDCSANIRYDVLNPSSVLDIDYAGCTEGYTSPGTAMLGYTHGVLTPAAGSATSILCPNSGQVGNLANCIQPPVLAFGKQGTGTASMPLTVSVNNCASSAFTIATGCAGSGSLILASPTYAAITGASAAEFAITGGTCGAGSLLASGGYCTLQVTYTPATAASDSATLTVYDNGTTSSQTISLTGTGVTVSPLSACGTLSSANTNYQLTQNVSAAGSCFPVSASGVDLNLNGYAVTYCSSGSTSYYDGISPNTNTVIHNGTIQEGANCSGNDPVNGYWGSAAVGHGGTNTQLYNLVINVGTYVKRAKVWSTDQGSGGTMHDVIYTNTDNWAATCTGYSQCGTNARAEDEGYSILGGYDNKSGSGTTIYNLVANGGPQGAVVGYQGGNSWTHNLMNPGRPTVATSNGFAFQLWYGTGTTIAYNIVQGTGTAGACVECRGIQVSTPTSPYPTYSNAISSNVILSTDNPNNQEYSGCEIGGNYAMQYNFAGTGNNIANGNSFTSVSHSCQGFGYSASGGDASHGGPNQINNSTIACRHSVAGDTQACAGIRMDDQQYGSPDYTVQFTNDVITGDTSATYVWDDGQGATNFYQCTFGKGPNPVSGWVTFSFGDNGYANSSTHAGPFYIVDPIFTGGATKSSNNFSSLQSGAYNSSPGASYVIEWTETPTILNGSAQPINGATVRFTDSQSNTYTCTTDSTGQCSTATSSTGAYGGRGLVLRDVRYGNPTAGGTLNYNNYALQVTASGYTTYNASALNCVATNSATCSPTINMSGGQLQASTPTFNPANGYSGTPTTVSISTSTSACLGNIYWSATNNPPTTSDNHGNSAPVLASGNLYAKVINCSGYTDSAAGSAGYTITVPVAPAPTMFAVHVSSLFKDLGGIL